ncbi:MAG: hypothetical protein ABSA71_15445 [Desulfomonilia bacterium]|jgi:hypothetical protein
MDLGDKEIWDEDELDFLSIDLKKSFKCQVRGTYGDIFTWDYNADQGILTSTYSNGDCYKYKLREGFHRWAWIPLKD